jgi:hypothetical protein
LFVGKHTFKHLQNLKAGGRKAGPHIDLLTVDKLLEYEEEAKQGKLL